MAVSIKQNFKHAPVQEETQLKSAFEAVLADLAELRASVTGITAALDVDTGVNSTNYAANNDPAAAQLVS